jgi:hypothetical protein
MQKEEEGGGGRAVSRTRTRLELKTFPLNSRAELEKLKLRTP